MERYLVLDSRGQPLARLETDYAGAVNFVFKERRIPGAVDLIGDNTYSDGDIKAVESQLVATFQAGGLSEKEAQIAARGRERDRPTRDFLPTIRPYQTATAGSSSRTHFSESQERQRRALELREPTWTDRASELTELEERGAIIESGAGARGDAAAGVRAVSPLRRRNSPVAYPNVSVVPTAPFRSRATDDGGHQVDARRANGDAVPQRCRGVD